MCESKNLKEVLNLGKHSLVNSYLKIRFKKKGTFTSTCN